MLPLRLHERLCVDRRTTRSQFVHLEPNDFNDTAQVARTLNEFEHHYSQIAKPFDWTFTRQDLADLLDRLENGASRDSPLDLAA
jgi:hypothetical protein